MSARGEARLRAFLDGPRFGGQAILIGIFALLFAAGGVVGFRADLLLAGTLGAYDLLVALVWCAGHALGMTWERRRRGREVGAWRFFAFLAGPVAVWVHLAREYRLRALALIPASILLYGLLLGTPYVLGLGDPVAEGRAHQERGEHAAAVVRFTQAIRWRRERPDAHYGRARSRYLEKDPAGAAEDLRRALRLAPAGWPSRPEAEAFLRRLE